MGLTGKILVSLLLLFINIQTFAEIKKVLSLEDLQDFASDSMLQPDGSIIFDGKKDYLKMDNPAINSESMAVYMKFKLTSSNFLNRTIELINTADVGVEEDSFGNWGLSVNYTKNGM